MTQHKDLTAIHCLYDVHTGFVRLRENGQTIVFADVGGTHLGVARVRCAEDIIKAAQQRLLRQQNMVLENTGHFLGQHVLRNTVVIIQTGLRPPADVQRGMNVRFSPVHDLGQFLPVFDFLKRHGLYRRTGDDKTVIFLVADIVERLVEGEKMILRRIFGMVRFGLDQIDLDLDRRVG